MNVGATEWFVVQIGVAPCVWRLYPTLTPYGSLHSPGQGFKCHLHNYSRTDCKCKNAMNPKTNLGTHWNLSWRIFHVGNPFFVVGLASPLAPQWFRKEVQLHALLALADKLDSLESRISKFERRLCITIAMDISSNALIETSKPLGPSHCPTRLQ